MDTAVPEISNIPSSEPFENKDTVEFSHSSGLFAMEYPSNWQFHEMISGVKISNSGGGTELVISVTNTGVHLDRESLERAAIAREKNIFQAFDEYHEIEKQIDEQGHFEIRKELIKDRKEWVVSSTSCQIGQGIMVVDVWVQKNLGDNNRPVIENVIGSISVNQDLVGTLPLYAPDTSYQWQNELFTVDISPFWSHQRFEDLLTIVDTWISPDEHAVIQKILYDDGESVPIQTVGDFAVVLLREFYTKDIVVVSYRPVENGKHELVWTSKEGNYHGWTYYETKNTSFIVFTIMVDNSNEAVYLEYLLDHIDDYIKET